VLFSLSQRGRVGVGEDYYDKKMAREFILFNKFIRANFMTSLEMDLLKSDY
jgi:hypothetical protein